MLIRSVLIAALLSLSLPAALASETQNTETPEEQQACMYDAFRVCGHAIPSRERVIACFRDNLDDLSALCRQVMLRYNKPAPRARKRMTNAP
ncbi:MAG: hypothetical protein FJX62_11745 [Alphaproteobacteria bacterium]|nr:hypothetical protein [Alphaproteobacteria bacterium]